MERLEHTTVETFLEKLAEGSFPSPASGSAAAATAGMAAALLEKSAIVTMKKGDKTLPIDLIEIEKTRQKCAALATEDVEALTKVIRAAKLRKKDPEQYEQAMQEATEPLILIAKQCVFILENIQRIVPDCSKKIFAELIGAALMAEAAGQAVILGAEMNVRLLKDDEYKEAAQYALATLKKACREMKESIMETANL